MWRTNSHNIYMFQLFPDLCCVYIYRLYIVSSWLTNIPFFPAPVVCPCRVSQDASGAAAMAQALVEGGLVAIEVGENPRAVGSNKGVAGERCLGKKNPVGFLWFFEGLSRLSMAELCR